MTGEELKRLQDQCSPAALLAVSKLQPVEKIRSLYDMGQRDFGENYVQEALAKQDSLQEFSDIHWHLIGHLQKNKAKQVVGRFHLIHSVDSLELAQVLSQQCEKKGLQQKILLQVNIAQEHSKEGFLKDNLLHQWQALQDLPKLQICGLMTMPPLTENPQEVRPYFRHLRLLREKLVQARIDNRHTLEHLSMGTSHDFAVAVEEGASLVRLGTILFGERPRKV